MTQNFDANTGKKKPGSAKRVQLHLRINDKNDFNFGPLKITDSITYEFNCDTDFDFGYTVQK